MRIEFKPARMIKSHVKYLFDLRNDPLTRKMSFNQKEISWQEHTRYLSFALRDMSHQFYIIYADGKRIGVFKDYVHPRKPQVLELSWTINPKLRGKGYGSKILSFYIKRHKTKLVFGETYLIAKIKPGNVASQKMVIKEDFILLDTTKDYQLWIY